VKLCNYLEKGFIVLFFFPYDFECSFSNEIYEPKCLLNLNDISLELKASNVQTFALSTDSHDAHLTWIDILVADRKLGKFFVPLVSDLKKEIRSAYGVLDENGAARPSLFIIDKKGTIRYSEDNLAELFWIMSGDRLLKLVKYIQKF
jgi:peroxiredoxin (alkyl hydroperoxide reductase subunit C)